MKFRHSEACYEDVCLSIPFIGFDIHTPLTVVNQKLYIFQFPLLGSWDSQEDICMAGEENDNNQKYLLHIERRLSRLEGVMKIVLVMLSVIGGLIIAIILSKI